MYKLIILLLVVSIASSCSKGHLDVDLSKGVNTFHLKPKYTSTSSCLLSIHGEIDCPFVIEMDSENSLQFESGEINFERTYEWYSGGKGMTIYSDSCTAGNSIKIEYYFSSVYFGQK